jgi:hypothetical protein
MEARMETFNDENSVLQKEIRELNSGINIRQLGMHQEQIEKSRFYN